MILASSVGEPVEAAALADVLDRTEIVETGHPEEGDLVASFLVRLCNRRGLTGRTTFRTAVVPSPTGTLADVSTRRLIIAALLCGLAILVAFSLQLLLVL